MLLRALGERALQIKLSVLGIDHLFAERRRPMPAQRNDAMPADIPVDRMLRGSMTPPSPREPSARVTPARSRPSTAGNFAGGVGDMGQLKPQRVRPAPALLLAGEDLLSVDVAEVGQERLDLRRGVWRHRCVKAERCRGATSASTSGSNPGFEMRKVIAGHDTRVASFSATRQFGWSPARMSAVIYFND